MGDERGVTATLRTLLREIEDLLKRPELGLELSARGVNSSLALTAVAGLEAYLAGNKQQAADDLGTAAEEIRARLETARRLEKDVS